MKKILCILAMLGAAVSCIYSYEPDIETDEAAGFLVVDGEIILGGTSVIKLGRITPITGDILSAPTGTAWVESDDGARYESTGTPSSSIEIPTVTAVLGHDYRAHILVDGEEYVSEWLTPKPAPEIQAIDFDATDNMVHVLVTMNGGEEGTGFIGLTFEETWEFHSDFEAEYIINPETWTFLPMTGEYPYYWCWRSARSKDMTLVEYANLRSGQINRRNVYSFSRYNNRNHKKYSIVVQARTLSEEAYDYRRYIQDLSETGGDLFTPEPGTMKGNLHCETNEELRVVGLVNAAILSSKRAFMGATYLLERTADESILTLIDPTQMPYYYNTLNYRPVKDITRDEVKGVGWGPERCINCIVAGGTQEKPDFWDDAKI